MGQASIRVYNSTSDPVRINIINEKNFPNDQVVPPGEILSLPASLGWNTVNIVSNKSLESQRPYEASYNLHTKISRSLIIKKKAGLLTMVRSRNDNIKAQIFDNINLEERQSCNTGFLHIYNNTNEVLKVNVTNFHNRNTDQILLPNESSIIPSPMGLGFVIFSYKIFNLINFDKGRNLVQILNSENRTCATYTENSHQDNISDYPGEQSNIRDLAFLMATKKEKLYSLVKAKWVEYGKSWQFD